MTGDIAAAGDIATGALTARAFEPRAGEPAPHGEGHGACLNCGTPLIGAYCHVCGQSGHVHKTLASVGHDLLHGAFHFEGKIWRTLPMLVLHPGELTRRYIDGERVRFVSPLALFLFFVFLMFAAFHSLGGDMGADLTRGVETRAERLAHIDGQIAATQAKLVRAQGRVAAGKGDDDTRDDIVGYTTSLKSLATARQVAAAMPETGDDRRDVVNGLHTGWARLDHGIAKANANPELALYKLQSAAYKYSWAMIPISVPFVALLFLWRRRFRLYDHTIFVIYSLAFMMLLTSVVTVLMMLGVSGAIYGMLISFAPPVHLFVQLRGTYGLRWFSAAWRTVALMVFGTLTLVLFALLLLGLGLME